MKPKTIRIVIQRGTPIAAFLRTRMDQHPDAELLALSHLSPAAFYRAKAGAPVNDGTALRIEKALDELEATKVRSA